MAGDTFESTPTAEQEFHLKMAEANSKGFNYDPNDPTSPTGRNAQLIKEGEELMAQRRAEEAASMANKGKLQLLMEKLKTFAKWK